MKTISGLFDTHEEASKAVEALEDAGIASDEISVVGPDSNTADGAAEGAGIGAAVGGLAACLLGLVLFNSWHWTGRWRRLARDDARRYGSWRFGWGLGRISD